MAVGEIDTASIDCMPAILHEVVTHRKAGVITGKFTQFLVASKEVLRILARQQPLAKMHSPSGNAPAGNESGNSGGTQRSVGPSIDEIQTVCDRNRMYLPRLPYALR